MPTEIPNTATHREHLAVNDASVNKEDFKVKFLTVNLFLRPSFVTNSGTNDLKFERLRQFCDLYLAKFDVICFQELFSWLVPWKEMMVHEA